MRWNYLSLCGIALALTGCTKSARIAPRVDVGDVVRAGVDSDTPVAGTVAARDDSTLRIDTGESGEPVAVELASLRSLERHNRHDTRGPEGAFIGAIVGFAAGAVVDLSQAEPGWIDSPGLMSGGSGGSAKWTMVGIAAGAGVGYLIGHAIHHESWESMRLPGVTVDATPTPDGARVAIEWRH